MINQNKIVPIDRIDLISLYGLILKAANVSVTALDAISANGDFKQSANNATVICSEPVRTLDFASTATAGTVYFVPAYDYSGFKINGTVTATTGATVVSDGATLYTAALSSGTITITKVGF